MNFYAKTIFAASVLAWYANAAQAATYVVFDDFDGGIANFNSTVTGTGATAKAVSLVAGSNGVTTDFSITRPSGAGVNVQSPYSLSNANPGRQTSGGVVDISPSGSSKGIGAKASGLTFTFVNPVNALGFEVGDWATCCQNPTSDLYIQFGSSTPILVGSSKNFGDQFLTNGGAGVFVGAFDNSSTFSSVSFWGDGFGEFLVAGGTVRFANIGQGTPLPGAIPEPATWMMMLMGFGLIGAAMRRKRQNVQVSFG